MTYSNNYEIVQFIKWKIEMSLIISGILLLFWSTKDLGKPNSHFISLTRFLLPSGFSPSVFSYFFLSFSIFFLSLSLFLLLFLSLFSLICSLLSSFLSLSLYFFLSPSPFLFSLFFALYVLHLNLSIFLTHTRIHTLKWNFFSRRLM